MAASDIEKIIDAFNGLTALGVGNTVKTIINSTASLEGDFSTRLKKSTAESKTKTLFTVIKNAAAPLTAGNFSIFWNVIGNLSTASTSIYTIVSSNAVLGNSAIINLLRNPATNKILAERKNELSTILTAVIVGDSSDTTNLDSTKKQVEIILDNLADIAKEIYQTTRGRDELQAEIEIIKLLETSDNITKLSENFTNLISNNSEFYENLKDALTVTPENQAKHQTLILNDLKNILDSENSDLASICENYRANPKGQRMFLDSYAETKIHAKDLSYIDFKGSFLNHPRAVNSFKFIDCNFNNVKLENSVFSNCDFSGVIFNGNASLRNCKFDAKTWESLLPSIRSAIANGVKVDLTGCTITGAKIDFSIDNLKQDNFKENMELFLSRRFPSYNSEIIPFIEQFIEKNYSKAPASLKQLIAQDETIFNTIIDDLIKKKILLRPEYQAKLDQFEISRNQVETGADYMGRFHLFQEAYHQSESTKSQLSSARGNFDRWVAAELAPQIEADLKDIAKHALASAPAKGWLGTGVNLLKATTRFVTRSKTEEQIVNDVLPRQIMAMVQNALMQNFELMLGKKIDNADFLKDAIQKAINDESNVALMDQIIKALAKKEEIFFPKKAEIVFTLEKAIEEKVRDAVSIQQDLPPIKKQPQAEVLSLSPESSSIKTDILDKLAATNSKKLAQINNIIDNIKNLGNSNFDRNEVTEKRFIRNNIIAYISSDEIVKNKLDSLYNNLNSSINTSLLSYQGMKKKLLSYIPLTKTNHESNILEDIKKTIEKLKSFPNHEKQKEHLDKINELLGYVRKVLEKEKQDTKFLDEFYKELQATTNIIAGPQKLELTNAIYEIMQNLNEQEKRAFKRVFEEDSKATTEFLEKIVKSDIKSSVDTYLPVLKKDERFQDLVKNYDQATKKAIHNLPPDTDVTLKKCLPLTTDKRAGKLGARIIKGKKTVIGVIIRKLLRFFTGKSFFDKGKFLSNIIDSCKLKTIIFAAPHIKTFIKMGDIYSNIFDDLKKDPIKAIVSIANSVKQNPELASAIFNKDGKVNENTAKILAGIIKSADFNITDKDMEALLENIYKISQMAHNNKIIEKLEIYLDNPKNSRTKEAILKEIGSSISQKDLELLQNTLTITLPQVTKIFGLEKTLANLLPERFGKSAEEIKKQAAGADKVKESLKSENKEPVKASTQVDKPTPNAAQDKLKTREKTVSKTNQKPVGALSTGAGKAK